MSVKRVRPDTGDPGRTKMDEQQKRDKLVCWIKLWSMKIWADDHEWQALHWDLEALCQKYRGELIAAGVLDDKTAYGLKKEDHHLENELGFHC